MHISEGYLSGPVLISGAALATVGTAIGLKKLDYDNIAQAGMLSAAFFVASLVHVPVGPSSAHLIMNGLVGLLLGWSSFPVIVVALLLQAVFFQFGGLTTLGVNTVIMATPAVLVHYLCMPWIRRPGWLGYTASFACGAGAIALSAIIMASSLLLTDEKFLAVAGSTIFIHLPIMLIEGIVTVFCVGFLKKVKPEVFLPDTQINE
jgi:cobalt/nickel transport system permease protein